MEMSGSSAAAKPASSGREAKETHMNIGRRKGDVASVGDDVVEDLFTTCRGGGGGGGGADNGGVTNPH
jgi:hypothetical protein